MYKLIKPFSLLMFLFYNACGQAQSYEPKDRTWVKKANDRIDKYRKSNLNIKVIDRNGKPASGVTIDVQQLRSSFSFGSAVSSRSLLMEGLDGDKYRKIVKSHFNEVVLENDLKWENWINGSNHNYNIEQTMESLRWLKTNGIKTRGHYLVWAPVTEYSFYKSALTINQYAHPQQYRSALLKHIKEVLDSTKGLISEWDAINHIVTLDHPNQIEDKNGNRILLPEYVGKDIYGSILTLARNSSVNTPMYVNEEILPLQVTEDVNNRYFKQISELIDSGKNVDGIGFMGHFLDKRLPSMTNLESIFNRFSKFHIPIKITEFDVRFGKIAEKYQQTEAELLLQKNFTEDFFRLAFSQPAVNGIVMWGFWEGQDWYPAAALYRTDWSLKPNGKAWEDLVLHQWRTNHTEQSNRMGELHLRGFRGDYVIRVGNSKQAIATRNVHLGDNDLSIVIQI